LRRTRRTRGAALVVVLGVLTLTVLLAVAFVNLMGIERRASEGYVSSVRARFLADAGVSHAVAQVRAAARGDAVDSPEPPWLFRSNDGSRPGHGLDLDGARHPSYETRTRDGRVVSGILGGQFRPEGDTYIVKVMDSASQLNVNGPQPSLARSLVVLGREIARSYGLENPVPDLATADAILAYRAALPGGRFASEVDLERVPALGARRFRVLRDFVSVDGWRDEATLRPAPPDAALEPKFPRPLELGHEPRYPVSINTAPAPVLAAVFAGVRGYALRFVPDDAAVVRRDDTRVHRAELTLTAEIGDDQAARIADLVLERRAARGPFRTWRDVEAFVAEALVAPGVIAADQASALLANADPNARLRCSSPNAPLFRAVDKADLVHWTTELCFSSMGHFEVEAIGRVLAPDGSIESESRVAATVRAFDVVRRTTQRDFEIDAGFYRAVAGVGSTTDPAATPDLAVTYPEALEALAQARGSTTYGAEDASPFDGQVGLSPEWASLAAGPAPSFAATFRLGFPADLAAGAPANAGTRVADRSIAAGGGIARDGTLGWRQAPPGETARDLSYETAANVPLDAGSAELWVKLPAAPEEGSDEALVYASVRHPQPPAPMQNARVDVAGVAWRLERYGSRIVSTRFFFGHPDPSSSPYPLAWSEELADISDWRPNEWHHIFVRWEEGIRQRLFIDGRPAGWSFSLAAREGTNPTRVRRFRIASNEPVERVFVGGYRYENPAAADVHRTGRFEAGPIERFANATVDDLRFAADPQTDDHPERGFPPPDRYRSTRFEPARFRGAILVVPAGAPIGTVSYTARYPEGWERTPLGAEALPVRLRAGATPASLRDVPEAGGPVESLPATGPTAGVLLYEVAFENAVDLTPLSATAFLDDVTVTILGRPQVLSLFAER